MGVTWYIHCGTHGVHDFEMDDLVICNPHELIKDDTCGAMVAVVVACQNYILEWRANWRTERPTDDVFQEIHDSISPTPSIWQPTLQGAIETKMRVRRKLDALVDAKVIPNAQLDSIRNYATIMETLIDKHYAGTHVLEGL